MTMTITQSELRTFRTCRRKWWLSEYRGLRLKEEYQKPSAASLGSLVHVALEADHNGESWEDTLSEFVADVNERFADNPDYIDDYEAQAEQAQIMIEGYFQWLEETGADQWLTAVEAEQLIEAEFEGTTLRGKLDERVVDESGNIFFKDYKTVGNFTDIETQAELNEQFLHYSLILKLNNGDVPVGGIWRMLKKSKRTDRTLSDDGKCGEFYSEHQYEFNDHQIEAYKARLRGMVRDIHEVRVKLDGGAAHHSVVYPTPSKDCSWACQYRAVCPMFDDGSRVEDFISDWYDSGKQFERYKNGKIS